MLLAKKDQYYKIISDYENNKFFDGFKTFLQIFNILLFSVDNGYLRSFIAMMCIMMALCLLFGFIFPFMPFYLIKSFISLKKYELVVLSSINLISYIFATLGLKGKVYCLCLYRPYQWAFFMIISDIITFICNLNIFIAIMDPNYYEKNDIDDDYLNCLMIGFIGSIFYSITFLVLHIKISIKLIILFNTLRTLETNVIKFCTLEYINELKRKSEINN